MEESMKHKPIVNPYVPYSYEHMKEDALKLCNRYPDIIQLDTIGHSVEGRTCRSLSSAEEKRKLSFAVHIMHEKYITSAYLMKKTEQYAKIYSEQKGQNNYGNYNVKNLLKQITMYIIPMVNPDGVNLVINGIDSVTDKKAVEAMTMVKTIHKEWKANISRWI